MRRLLLALAIAWPLGAAAHPHTAKECREGGDFIHNAARSRDGGATREFFVGRLEADLAMISSLPPALRWFAQDADDEEFLRTEVAVVFDAPASSEQHRVDFLERCARRTDRLAGVRS